MSSPLAIGAVSAVLRNLLDSGLVEAGAAMGTTVHVSAVAPDRIDLDKAGDTPRLNVFLYRVTPNQGWQNAGLPSRSAVSGERLTNAPLALDLHYVLTAYGRIDFEAEILLGYAMHLLHERPVLDRAAIRRALSPLGPIDTSLLPQAFQALTASDLADQVELIRITPTSMSSDDMSRLWSAIQSHYRPSSTYQVSVVLIEGTRPAVTPLPVLSRGKRDPVTHRERGVVVNPDLLPGYPTLFSADPISTDPEKKQSGVRLGDQVVISGVRLSGTGHTVRLMHRLFATPFEITPLAADVEASKITITLPKDAAAQTGLAAGQLALSVLFTPTGEPDPRETNSVPLVLAPVPVIAADAPLPAATALRGGAPLRLTVTMAAHPQVRIVQRATLMLNTVEASALPRVADADPLVFEFPNEFPAGSPWVRLRVDGADSLLLDRSGPEPVFDPNQKLIVP